MRRSNLRRGALSVCVAAALLEGCGGSQPPIGVQGAMRQASALVARTNSANYKVVYSFGALPDGSSLDSDLIGTGSTFYGTTFAGGAYRCGSATCGTVFSITTDGAEKVLHSFGKGTGGIQPVAGMTFRSGTLVGTTYLGGVHCGGTVYTLTP